MNLQFLSGNPKRGKSRKKPKKGLAKRKKGSNLKGMRKVKKNPATVTLTKNGKSKTIAQLLTRNEQAAVRAAAHKQAKRLKPAAAKKMLGLFTKRAKKETLQAFRIARIKAKAAKRPGRSVDITQKDDIAWALKKMKLSKHGRPSKATAAKHIAARTMKAEKSASKAAKAAKLAAKKALRARVMKNLNIKDEEGFKKRLSSLRKKKGSSVAKKRKKKAVKRKHTKRKHTKRKHTKKKHTKRKHTKKRHVKKRVKKSHKRKVSRRRKSAKRGGRYIKSAKSVRIYRSSKRGRAMKVKTFKRPRGGKLSAFIKNPFGGAMKGLDKVNVYLEKGIGHSAQEAGTLFAAGALVGSIEGLVVKGIGMLKLPIPLSMAKYVPTIGTLAAAGAAHYFAEKQFGKNHIAVQVAKAVIAAAIVKAGDQFVGGMVKQTLGMSGVVATMGYHSPADFGEIPRLSAPMGYHSPADFGEIPRVVPGLGEIPRMVPGMGGVIATPGMNGVVATMGYHSNADFGGVDGDDIDSPYEDSNEESMC